MTYSDYLTRCMTRLKESIKDSERRPVLFVGSGMSLRYIDAPNWESLLEMLFSMNSCIQKPIEYYMQENNQDFLKIATELVDFYRDYFWTKEIKEQHPKSLYTSDKNKNIFLKYQISLILKEKLENLDIDNHPLNEEIKLLSKVKPETIITTNYDNFLDSVFDNYDTIVGQKALLSRKSSNSFKILKIHGSVDSYEEIVIDENDYSDFTNKQVFLVAKLLTYFVEYPVVFLGYSISDTNIRLILKTIKDIFNYDVEELLENMWFIDWNSEVSSKNSWQEEKQISLGNGESVRMNYIEVESYEELYRTLYQETVDVTALKMIEDTMYNIVKSSSIVNLEVDVANIQYMAENDNFLQMLSRKDLFLNVAQIDDYNLLPLNFPYTATGLACKLTGNHITHWYESHKQIKKIIHEKGIDIRATTNKYHAKISGGISRYSEEAFLLLMKVKNNEPYEVDLN